MVLNTAPFDRHDSDVLFLGMITHNMELRVDALENPQVVTDALPLGDPGFNLYNYLSLQEIIVVVHEGGTK